MSNSNHTFTVYNPVHKDKMKGFINILSSFPYGFNCLEMDEHLEGVRQRLQKETNSFENAFFREYQGKQIDPKLNQLLGDHADLLFNKTCMQKIPDVITLPPQGYHFFDLKLATASYPNSISINLDSYYQYWELSNKFDIFMRRRVHIIICGENDDNYRVFSIIDLVNGAIPYFVYYPPHISEEKMEELKRVFGEWRLRPSSNHDNSHPYLVIDINQFGVVDLHKGLYHLLQEFQSANVPIS